MHLRVLVCSVYAYACLCVCVCVYVGMCVRAGETHVCKVKDVHCVTEWFSPSHWHTCGEHAFAPPHHCRLSGVLSAFNVSTIINEKKLLQRKKTLFLLAIEQVDKILSNHQLSNHQIISDTTHLSLFTLLTITRYFKR